MEIRYRTDLNKLMPKRQLVGAEIGVAEGLHARDMLQNWKIKKLYLVDVWQTLEQPGDASEPQEWHDANYDNMIEITKPWEKKMTVLKGLSVEMAKKVKDESLDFIYLDGDHSYEGVLADLEAWYPKVKEGGLVSGHDYLNSNYGVQRAVLDFAKGKKVEITRENKDEDAGFYFIK